MPLLVNFSLAENQQMMLYDLPFAYCGSLDSSGKAEGWGKAMLSEDFVISGTFLNDQPHGLCLMKRTL